MKKDKITLSQFEALQNIFDYFNKHLFNNELNDCILNFSRKSKAYGFFAPERWSKRNQNVMDAIENSKNRIHEISLNPEFTKNRRPDAWVSTIVHEMVHLWQQDFGKPSKSHHNKEWATKMKEIGLYPSSTGEPGGKETGQKVSHYIIENGAFQKHFSVMPNDYLLPFLCSQEMSGKVAKNKNKTKYTCNGCETNIWGKADLNIICEECGMKFLQEEKEEDEEN